MFLFFGLLLSVASFVVASGEAGFEYNANLIDPRSCGVVNKLYDIDPRLAEFCNKNSKLSNKDACNSLIADLYYGYFSMAKEERKKLYDKIGLKAQLEKCDKFKDPIVHCECTMAENARVKKAKETFEEMMTNGKFKAVK